MHGPDDPALPAILDLMRSNFAYMDDVVDPPSSIHRLTLEGLQGQARTAEVWSLGPPLCAAVILTAKPNALYIGKLCVSAKARRRGMSRRLVDHAAERARALCLPKLELETRIELTANHATFRAMGFAEVARTAHKGYAKPTAITFQKSVPEHTDRIGV